MMHGPERGVGEAEIIFAIVAFRERHGRQRQLVEFDARGVELGVIRHDIAVPSEPHPAALSQRVENAHRQSAERLAAPGVRDAVGHHHESFHMAFSQDRDRRMAQLMIPTME